jgi:hypothetical protein
MDLNIEVAGVKVMRSYDYCHFEVTLSSSLADLPEGSDRFKAVDDLRKQAARLADKAVEQYKIAKAASARMLHSDSDRQARLLKIAEPSQEVPDHERTPEEKAILKAISDDRYAARQYDYQDDWHNEPPY